VYLNYLVSRFLGKGGFITRGHVQHINQVLEGGSHPFREHVEVRRNERVSSPDAVIVCVGLGARFLGGVEDRSVYPSRGQTVILRAPWVRFGKSFEGESDEWTYIIPRKCGDVVVGGTEGVDDWCVQQRIFIVIVWISKGFFRHTVPRPETTKEILRRGLELCPELAPPQSRSGNSPEVEDLLPTVVEEACGLRPRREGGFRIELEYMETLEGRRIPVVHNYG